MTEIATIPFRGNELQSVLVDGEPRIVFRPVVESIGMDYSTQLAKLRNRSWASCRAIPTTGADGKTYNMITVDMPTFLMWLATVNEARVGAEVRPLLVAYQTESSSVITDYWTKGGAINPRATEDQLAAIISRAEGQARVLALCAGLVDPKWLEAKTRHVVARALGEEPELNPTDRPLTVGEYLADRGVTAEGQRAISSNFGKKLKAAFRREHDREPGVSDRFIDGALRPVAAYTEADRPLFDEVWAVLRAQLGIVS